MSDCTPNYKLDLQLFRHADHAYKPDGTAPGPDVMPGLKLFTPFKAGNDYAYAALYDDMLVLAFRGSNLAGNLVDGIMDWISNFDCKMTDWNVAGAYKIKNHDGFLTGWNSLRPEILKHIGTIQAVRQTPIVCVGHSRGGAIASDAALEMASSYSYVDLLSWGAPLVTDQKGTDLARKMVRRSVVYVNDGDPVAGMPLRGPERGDPAFIRWDGLVKLKEGEPAKPVRHGWFRRACNRFGRWVFDRIRQREQDPELIERTALLHDPKLYGQGMADAAKSVG